jgi:hypothetical protein
MANVSYASITPSDTVPQPALVMAIFVGGTGDVAVKATTDSAAVTLTAPTVGVWLQLPHPVLFVMATDTTATALVAALATSARPMRDSF